MSSSTTSLTVTRADLGPDLIGGLTGLRSKQARGLVFAFTSARKGEGVTYSVRALRDQLSEELQNKAVVIEGEVLLHDNGSSVAPSTGSEREQDITTWLDQTEVPLDFKIDGLRNKFDFVLVDCGSMEASHDVFRLGPLVDGVVLVVGAGIVQKRGVKLAMRALTMQLDNVVGCILNRRTYPIPNFLYRLLG